MPYSIETEDGIIIDGIPDDIQPDAQVLKDRVTQERAKAGMQPPTEAAPAVSEAMTQEALAVAPAPQERPEDETTLGEAAIGVGETALTLGTGAVGGTIGTVAGTLKGIAQSIKEGKFGTQEGARMIEQAADELAASLTYAPRTEAGQEYTQAAGEALAPLEALTPLTAEITAAGQAARMARPSMIPSPKATVTPAEAAISQAEARGIPVMTSDVRTPRTFAAKWLQTTGERIPVAGTGALRETQQKARISAIRNTLREFGADDAAQASDDVMADLARKRSKDITKYSTMKKDVFDRVAGKGSVPVDKTLKEVDAQINKLNALGTENVRPAVARLEDFKQAIGNQNINNVEELRKILGESFKEPDMASVRGVGEKAVASIYGTLREEMGDFIKNVGDKRDFTKWKVANNQLSSMMGDLKSTALKSVLKRGDATPEAVRTMLFSKKPSEIKLLYKNLPPEGKRNAQIAILHEALEKSGGMEELSPAKFSTQLKKLSNQTGIFFKGDDKAVIDGLSEALSITKRADEFAAHPPTGAQLSIPVGAAVLTDMLGGAGAGIAGAGTIGIAARVYESAPIRNALIKIGKFKPGSVAGDAAVGELMTAILSIQEKEEK